MIEYLNHESVKLTFKAPYKQSVHVVGEFNNWEVSDEYAMRKEGDGETFSIIINHLQAGQEYAYQFLINKKIIVIIDDMDRISGEDIMDIFSLIKNTVDFKNNFFLVSLDLDYTKKAILEKYPLLDVQRYLEKIFQLQILLTPILFEDIKNLIKGQLDKYLRENDLAG